MTPTNVPVPEVRGHPECVPQILLTNLLVAQAGATQYQVGGFNIMAGQCRCSVALHETCVYHLHI